MLEIVLTDPQDMYSGHLKKLASFLLDLAGERPASTGTDNPSAAPIDHRSATERAADANANEDDELVEVRPATIVTAHAIPAAPAASVIPLPPVAAPSPAAADLFPTAPAAPTAGVPTPPSATIPPVPAVPQPPAPSAPAAGTSPAGVEVDKHGLPWSAKIHASTKTKNADGSWRQRRNLDPAVLATEEASLRALMAIPSPSAGPAAVPTPPAPPVPPATPSGEPVPNVPTPSAIPLPPATVPTPTPPVPPAPAAAASTAPGIGAFAALMVKITSNIAAQKLTEAQVNAALLEQLPDGSPIGVLAARPDLAAAMAARIDAMMAGGA